MSSPDAEVDDEDGSNDQSHHRVRIKHAKALLAVEPTDFVYSGKVIIVTLYEALNSKTLFMSIAL